MHSSSSDLAMFGRDILLSTQLPLSVTRRWMKPIAHISGLTLSVGVPWEIWGSKSNITSRHILDLYTKAAVLDSMNPSSHRFRITKLQSQFWLQD